MGEPGEARGIDGLPRRIPPGRPGVRMASFGPLPGQVGTARQWCWHGSGLSYDRAYALLVVLSELHTNALRHTASGRPFGRVRVEMERHGGLFRIAVTDDGVVGGGAGEPSVPCVGGAGGVGGGGFGGDGLGLRLVEELSRAWGWFGRPGSPLTVWAVVDPRGEGVRGRVPHPRPAA
ncbi:ATP-binding protein [Nocardiopsis lucentensis]|uniref:ATP-binding protein n=1 Tax=Nocardiopsis lucentensis TaxID=53441 RepID=UPI000348A20B|nr:ATP-binding protein [Nocardiopsis lucentensis]